MKRQGTNLSQGKSFKMRRAMEWYIYGSIDHRLWESNINIWTRLFCNPNAFVARSCLPRLLRIMPRQKKQHNRVLSVSIYHVLEHDPTPAHAVLPRSLFLGAAFGAASPAAASSGASAAISPAASLRFVPALALAFGAGTWAFKFLITSAHV